MKKRNRARSSSLFLLELIIAILFFSIASAVCVQFFVKSHSMSQESQDMNFAVSECSSIAEIVQTSDSQKDAVTEVRNLYPDAKITESEGLVTCSIYFDRNFNPCDSFDEDFSYYIEADFESDGSMITCDLISTPANNENAIYELEVKHNAQGQ
ncbi:MAG: hypothetical protein Q4D99_01435 [Bacillota bacterium]|nr:hypothetical protein [Bacillota bacterium]